MAHFNGRSLRPWDPRCPRLVCRVRKKDDDLRSGVGAQRGTGMHRDWVKQQQPEPPSPAILEHPPEGEGRRRESIVDVDELKHKSSASCASTNSSFLARNFPMRCFILKSATTSELEESVRTGFWRTQRHNEPVLGKERKLATLIGRSSISHLSGSVSYLWGEQIRRILRFRQDDRADRQGKGEEILLELGVENRREAEVSAGR